MRVYVGVSVKCRMYVSYCTLYKNLANRYLINTVNSLTRQFRDLALPHRSQLFRALIHIAISRELLEINLDSAGKLAKKQAYYHTLKYACTQLMTRQSKDNHARRTQASLYISLFVIWF